MGWSDFCLSFSAVVCVASIRIHFTTTGKAGPLHLFPHLSFPSSTQIIRMPWLTDLPSSFPTHRKDISRMYKRGTNSWCEYFIGFATKPRIVIRDSDDEKKKFQWRSEGVERQVLITSRKLEFGLPKKAKAVIGKSDTLKRVPRNLPWPLFLYPAFCFILKTHSCLFVLTFLYRYDHPAGTRQYLCRIPAKGCGCRRWE